MKKQSAFTLRSSNKPSIAKLMGVSPVKHTEIINSEPKATGIISDDAGSYIVGPSAIPKKPGAYRQNAKNSAAIRK